MNISSDEELIVAKLLIDENINKQLKRKLYMRKYYQERKENGYIKSSKKNKYVSFKKIYGPFLIEFT
tara:strand:- start:1353 stop:1553 length:201 start_codon:yes stop_codon:yes gene_type:complete